MEHPYKNYKLLTALLFLTLLSFATQAQTPGLIYRPATSSGIKVLDPNGDGYVSVSTAGFNTTTKLDEGASYSEIPYRQFPALLTEPTGDLNTGSSGGHTDLVAPTVPLTPPSTGSPISAYFDGTNLLFRIRLGGSSTASKGYSVLIDSDGTFNGTGTNPGFEYEVLFGSNFAVQVISHGPGGSTVVFNGSVDQYSQKAVAASATGGNADYFYDYYVPLSAFKGGIDASTALRMSGITITSAQSGITGTVSDVGGVNFQAYNFDAPAAWRDLINGFPPTSLSSLQTSGFAQIAAAAPVVNSPIVANSTAISGTSTEAAGSVVSVLRNGVSICGGTGQPACPTVSASGTWTLSGISSTLLGAGNTITATVTATNKSISPASNTVTVLSGVCIATTPPIITGVTGGLGNTTRQFVGTTSYSTNQRINIYSVAATAPLGSFTFNPATANSSTWTSPTAYAIGDNNYYATVTPLDASGNVAGCESLRSNQICIRNGSGTINAEKAAITSVTYDGATQNSSTSSSWAEIPVNTAVISGTVAATASSVATTIVLFINGIEQTNTNFRTSITTSTTTATPWTITIPASTLKIGDVLTVRTVRILTGGGNVSCSNSFSSPSNSLNVQETTTTPTINPLKCGLVTTISGTSSEPAGTVIQLYTGGTAGQRNGTLITQNGTSTAITATVTTKGTWLADLSSATGGGIAAGVAITARAKASGKVRSVNSSPVAAPPAPAGTLAINPIAEGSTSVSGTAPAGAAGANITLYIEGTPFPTPVLIASDGSWNVEGVSSLELFAGASVSATFTPTDQCESAKAAAVVVTCKMPVATYTLSATPSTICGGGTTSVSLSGSEFGISYRLLVNGVESGSSVLGTGSPITLVSGPITNTTATNATATLTFRARKISGTACDAASSSTATVTVRPQPITSGLTFTSTTQTACANAAVNFTLSGTGTNYNYQLFNEGTNQVVGSAVQGVSSGTINLSSGPVTTNTTFGLRVTVRSNESEPCVTTLPSQVSVTITSPSTTRAVYPELSKTCVGGSTRINVSTEPNSDFEYIVYRRSTTANGLGGDLALEPALRGNGSILSVPTGILSTAGTETFYVTVRRVTNNVCGIIKIVNEAQVEVTNNPLQAAAGADITVCGSSVVLKGNDVSPGIGTWQKVSGPSNVTFSSVNNPNATVQGLVSGTYELQWISQTTCGNSNTTTSDNVTIKVNCDATYTLAVPKYRDDYSRGETLATATDPDGTITKASIITGSVPPGMNFDTGTGAFTVNVPSDLAEGAYRLTVRLEDALGGVTLTTITLRIYGDSPAILPLPVELVYLTATVQQGTVNLQWLTASEKDNKEFVVERSADGEAFEAIGTVESNGNSSQPTEYSFADKNPLQGTFYYRLKQVDYGGEFAYSKVIAVSAKGIAAAMQLQVYPNPFDTELHMTVTAQKSGSATLQLVDMQGRAVHSGNVELQPGLNKLTLPLRFLRKGLYILQLNGSGINGTVKVLKQ